MQRWDYIAVNGNISCAPNNYRQKGPRIAKVVRRINCNVEPLEFGVVLSGKSWCSSQAIFPKGMYTWSIMNYSFYDSV